MAEEKPLTADEERKLIARAQKGDREAYAQIVLAYRERAFAGAMSLMQNYEDARDLTQEAFVRTFKHLDRFKLGRPFYPWYYRILRNLCLSYLQRHGLKRKISLDYLVEEVHVQFEDSGSKDPVEKIQLEQMTAHLTEAMEKLKPEFKEILAMKHFEEMSYQDIASALRIPIGTVMSRLFHARKALAKLMEKHKP